MSTTYLALEVRRTFRDRRSYLLALVLPPAVLVIVGVDEPGLLVSVALYGAVLATATGGASVAAERAQGWTRQLRLTPLRPGAYAVTKVLASMTLGGLSMVVTFAFGALQGVRMPVAAWVGCALMGWLVSAPFAALGLFAGYLLPVEAVTRVLSPVVTLLAVAGGLFVPLGGVLGDVAPYVPTWGAAVLARAPLSGELDGWAVVNVAVWTALFVAGAAWRFRRDTSRV
ncbi:ABC transporter permease [Promicromonospora sp. NPDC052451]|uniref:ABC transporter permease n=1 Tax=Promicromonospora sp. NPDC052451 TaxID=3364407 RepID=UPI0037C52FF2